MIQYVTYSLNFFVIDSSVWLKKKGSSVKYAKILLSTTFHQYFCCECSSCQIKENYNAFVKYKDKLSDFRPPILSFFIFLLLGAFGLEGFCFVIKFEVASTWALWEWSTVFEAPKMIFFRWLESYSQQDCCLQT